MTSEAQPTVIPVHSERKHESEAKERYGNKQGEREASQERTDMVERRR